MINIPQVSASQNIKRSTPHIFSEAVKGISANVQYCRCFLHLTSQEMKSKTSELMTSVSSGWKLLM